jgi:hypothetical protein
MGNAEAGMAFHRDLDAQVAAYNNGAGLQKEWQLVRFERIHSVGDLPPEPLLPDGPDRALLRPEEFVDTSITLTIEPSALGSIDSGAQSSVTYSFSGEGPNMAHGYRGYAVAGPGSQLKELSFQVDNLTPQPAMEFGRPKFPPEWALAYLKALDSVERAEMHPVRPDFVREDGWGQGRRSTDDDGGGGGGGDGPVEDFDGRDLYRRAMRCGGELELLLVTPLNANGCNFELTFVG